MVAPPKAAARRVVPGASDRIDLPTVRALALVNEIATNPAPKGPLAGVGLAVQAAATLQPALRTARLHWSFAYFAKHTYPRSRAAQLLAKKTGETLHELLQQAAKSAPEALRPAIARDADNLASLLQGLAATGRIQIPVPAPPTQLALLEQAALRRALDLPPAHSDALRDAFVQWREASSSYDLADLEAATTNLTTTIGKTLTPKARAKGGLRYQPSYFKRQLVRAAKTLSKSTPTAEARGVFVQLEAAVEKLIVQEGPTHPLVVLWRERVLPAAARSPHRWDKLANLVDGLSSVSGKDVAAVEQMIERVKGTLGEMLAISIPRYQQALADAVQHADQVASWLNRRAARAAGNDPNFVPPWRVQLPQFDLRAPGSARTAGSGMQLFMDDAVLVVKDSHPPQAFLIFEAQFKAGDAGTPEGIAQMVADQSRKLQGRIWIGNKVYELMPPPDTATVSRVLVGSYIPQSARKLSGRVEALTGPMDRAELSWFAAFMISVAGKVQP